MASAGFVRCPFDGGYLHHSFISTNGIDVYRCNSEDAFNDAGRFFITTASGPIEVTPTRQSRQWSYEIVDTERRRLQEETKKIDAELNARQKLYRDNMKELEQRQSELERHAAEVEDDG